MSHKLKDVTFDSTFNVLRSCCIFADTLPCRSCGMSKPVTAPVWPTRTDCACAGWALLYLFLKQKIIHHIKFWRNIPEHFRYSKGFKAIFPMCVELSSVVNQTGGLLPMNLPNLLSHPTIPT